MKAGKFLLATGIGMIPGTFAYAYLGHKMVAYKAYSTAMTIAGAVLLLLYILYRLYRKLNPKISRKIDTDSKKE